MQFSGEELRCVSAVLSEQRFAAYVSAANGDHRTALSLYRWNMELSAAFLVPLHIFEVSLRNSIARAIENTYGQNWPWEKSFQISLRNPPRVYSPRRDLQAVGAKTSNKGKVVAELKLVFWERMFTRSHDDAIWRTQFPVVFPNADRSLAIRQSRGDGFEKVQKIRDLRNRIAHHEPVFTRDLSREYEYIREMIYWTDDVTARWVDRIQGVTALIACRPQGVECYDRDEAGRRP